MKAQKQYSLPASLPGNESQPNVPSSMPKLRFKGLWPAAILFLALLAPWQGFGQLSGTYTIDPGKAASGANYKDFHSAICDLDSGKRFDGGSTNGKGISGSVVFKVADGVYNEYNIITSIPGSSLSNTVSFESGSGDSSKVILKWDFTKVSSTVNGVLTISGASNIIVSKITVKNDIYNSLYLAGDSASSILLLHACNNITVSHCRFIGSLSSPTLGVQSYFEGPGTDSNKVFLQNFFDSCMGGEILITANASSHAGCRDKFTTIEGNIEDENSAGNGMFLNASWQDHIIIEKNTSFSMIEIVNSLITSMSDNRLNNYSFISGCNGTSLSKQVFSNNIMNLKLSGLQVANSSYMDVSNNNIYISNASSNIFAFMVYNDKQIRIENNIVQRSLKGWVFLADSAKDLGVCDHNNYYPNDSIGYIAGNMYGSLAAWQSTAGIDAHSYIYNPKYNFSDDLFTGNDSLAGKGVYFSDVPVDFLGNPRNKTAPTIGAYELRLPKSDAGISSFVPHSCTNPFPLKIVLKNYGLTTLDSVTISWTSWTSTSKKTQSYKWEGSLNPDSTVIVSLGNYYSPGWADTIKAWTSMPNGVVDSVLQNDTAQIIDTLYSPSASYNANIGTCGKVCFQASPAPNSATSISSYVWSGNAAAGFAPLYIPARTGCFQYTRGGKIYVWNLTVTGPNGCSRTYQDSFVIHEYSGISLPPDTTVCANTSLTIKSTPVNAFQPIKVWWSTLKDSSGDSLTTGSITETITKDTSYRVNILDEGCTNYDSIKIHVSSSLATNAGRDTIICNGDSVKLGSNPVSGYSYSWSSNPTGFTSTLANPRLVPNASAAYYLTVTSNKSGCTGFDTAKVIVNALPQASFSNIPDSIFCGLDSVDWTYSSTGAASYLWKFGDGTSDTGKNIHKHLFTKTGSHYYIRLIVTNSSGCSDSAQTFVYPDANCVWPGDANYDKADNIYDVLAIGIGYNTKGHYRLDTITQWYRHGCLDWYQNFKSGTNYKHADCNGDGIIDSLDLGAVVRNYSQTHSKSGGATGGNPSDPALSLSISKDSVGTTDTLQIQMNLGTSAKQVNDIYGLCFSIKYDPLNVNQSKGIMPDFSKCWLGTLNKNLVYVIHNDSSNGVMDIGITRTDHNNISGYGQIGVLNIITPDNVGGKREVTKELNFDVENAKAIDNKESDISLYTSGDSTLFYGYSAVKSPNYVANHVKIYPNPANSVLHLDAYKDFISEITVSNILGESVLSQKCANLQQMDLNIENLIAGTYIINVQTGKGTTRIMFVKD